MNRFKLQLSKFDLGMLIAFVVITLLGGGMWYYLSQQLGEAQAKDAQVKGDFDTFSAKNGIIVSPANVKSLQDNGSLLKDQIDPVLTARLLSKENSKLRSIDRQDPVAWKHDLDDDTRALNAAAKTHGLTVPANFYFGFSRYLNQSPSDEQTAVLSKQLLGIKEIATILINAPVRSINAVRRTAEEDPHTANASAPEKGGSGNEEILPGYALVAANHAYTAYPIEVEFETSAENLRSVVDELVKSPYIFVIRSLNVQNSSPTSPQQDSLEKLAGGPASAPSVIDNSPGEVAASTPPKAPQYLFGNSYLKIKLRVDLIDWNAPPAAKPTP